MRKIANVNTGTVQDRNVRALFDEIFRASNENDTVDISQGFTVSGSFTATRTLNVNQIGSITYTFTYTPGTFPATRVLNVSAPTLANVAAVLATLLQDFQATSNAVAVLATLLEDLQRGGTNRNT